MTKAKMQNEESQRQSSNDVPLLTEFNPKAIPYQFKVIKDIRKKYDYSKGTHQVLLSGAVGSAKSLLCTHIILTHCLLNQGARVGIGRLTMPDLRSTLLDMILEHLGEPGEVVNYDHHKTTGVITFENRSTIQPFSWADKKYKRFRSYKFSLFCIEELTENDTPDAYDAIIQRMGRLDYIDEKVLLMATNPDDPEHWAYERLIKNKSPQVHVYYSDTEDNPFLPKSYVEMLKENLSEKMYRRMVKGEWISIAGENIYFAYSDDNFVNTDYRIDRTEPIHISYDFNIGEGKPMSVVLFQYIEDKFHFFDECILFSSRTMDTLEDMWSRGLINKDHHYIINGDATAFHRDTRSKVSDYEIITNYLAEKEVSYELKVPKSNPEIRTRHNLVNKEMRNANNKVSVYVYPKAKTLDKGFRLTKLKQGGQYIEDDSKYYQHCTTAAGYGIVTTLRDKQSKRQGTVIL